MSSDRLERLDTIMRSGRYLGEYEAGLGPGLGLDPGVILDIGAGDSSFATEVMMDPERQATVIAVDPSYAFRSPENYRTKELGVRAPSVAAFGSELPFPDQSVSGITSKVMFIHLGRKDAADILQDMLRVLEPDGFIRTGSAGRRRRLPEGASVDSKYNSLNVIKPADYEEWTLEQKQLYAKELAKSVSLSTPLHLVHRGIWRILLRHRNGYLPQD